MAAKIVLTTLMMLAGLAAPKAAEAASGRVFYNAGGKIYYLGTWNMVRNSRSSVGYSIVVNSSRGYVYRLFPSQRSVGGHVHLSYLGYYRGRSTSAGQVYLRTSAQGGYYSGTMRTTHQFANGGWKRVNGRWFKIYFTIDRR